MIPHHIRLWGPFHTHLGSKCNPQTPHWTRSVHSMENPQLNEGTHKKAFEG